MTKGGVLSSCSDDEAQQLFRPTGSKRKKKTTNASRKRQRVDDSEDETPL